MKISALIAVGTILLLVYSCNKENENPVIETESTMTIDIPVSGGNIEKSALNSATSVYSFSGTGSYLISGLSGIENKIYSVQKIRLRKGVELSFPVTNQEDKINVLLMEIGFNLASDNSYNMQKSVDLMTFEHTIKNGVLKIKMDDAFVDVVDKIDSNFSSIKIIISGESNYNIPGTARLEIPVTVESMTFSPRFELF